MVKGDGLVLAGCKTRVGRVMAVASVLGPSRCVVLLNMVAGPEEVDDALGPARATRSALVGTLGI